MSLIDLIPPHSSHSDRLQRQSQPSLAMFVVGGEPQRMTVVLTIVVRKKTHRSARSLTKATCFQSNSILSRRSCSASRLSFLSIVACTLPRTRDHCVSRPPSFPRSTPDTFSNLQRTERIGGSTIHAEDSPKLGLLLLLSSLLATNFGDDCDCTSSGLQCNGQLFLLLGGSTGS